MCEETISCTFVPGFHYEDRVKKMTYNYLGQTGFKVSEVSLGTMLFNNLFRSCDYKSCIDTVREALRSGINYIDTSPWYGESEKILGKALKKIPRKSYYIATKVGRYRNSDPRKYFDYSSHKTIQSVEHSLKKLRLDYIDLIQVADIEFAPTLDVIINECLPTLEKLKKDGKVKYIGITGYPVSVLKDCVQRSNTRISTVLSYSRMTLIDDTLNTYIPFFNDKRVGVINGSCTAMGLLTSEENSSWHPVSAETKEICREAINVCKSQKVEMCHLALHHAFRQKTVPTHVIATNTVKHLKQNLNIYYNGLKCVENDCLAMVNSRFFSKLTEKQRHWEGIELAEYLESIGM